MTESTESTASKLRRLYAEDGLDGPAIAARLGRSLGYVYFHMIKHGIPRRKPSGRPRKPLPLHEIIRLYIEEGWSRHRIAVLYGVSEKTIRNRLLDAGVRLDRRPKGAVRSKGGKAARAERTEEIGRLRRALQDCTSPVIRERLEARLAELVQEDQG